MPRVVPGGHAIGVLSAEEGWWLSGIFPSGMKKEGSAGRPGRRG